MNALFIANKPKFITSRKFLDNFARDILGVDKKRTKYGISGILDPFASGLLTIAFGQHTRLLPYIDLSKKAYTATLWLGATSPTLDITGIELIAQIPPFPIEKIRQAVESTTGQIPYTPPIFSGKKIAGKRAYDIARSGQIPELKPTTMTIYEIKLLHYAHPFVSFELVVSKGAYIRSVGEIIAKKLNTTGALSALKRTREGALNLSQIRAKNYAQIPIFWALNYEILDFSHDKNAESAIKNGQKIQLLASKTGRFIVKFQQFFSLLELVDGRITRYLLNQVKDDYADTFAQNQ